MLPTERRPYPSQLPFLQEHNMLKNILTVAALIVASHIQAPWQVTGHSTGIETVNVTETCRTGLYLALHPNTTGCDFSSAANLTDSCTRLNECIPKQNAMITDNCTADELAIQEVKNIMSFQVPIDLRSRCIKDSRGNFCKRLNATTDPYVCTDCEPQNLKLISNVTQNATLIKKYASLRAFVCNNATLVAPSNSSSGQDTKNGAATFAPIWLTSGLILTPLIPTLLNW
jgi:hypothetical protein